MLAYHERVTMLYNGEHGVVAMPEYTTEEAANLLKLNSPSTLRHAIRRQELRARKRGRDWSIDEQDLLAWFETYQPKARAKHKKGSDTP